MSDETKSAETQELAPGDVLFQRVYLPEFLKHAAARGCNIQSEEDLAECLKIAAMIRCHEEAAAAQAAPSGNLLKTASARLAELTFGPESPAAGYMQDPDVVQAVSASA